MSESENLNITRISFETIKRYWVENKHFNDPKKNIIKNVRYLGPYVNTEENPRGICYGLYTGPELIGVTMLYTWNKNWVRYRTLNILPRWRGRDLGWLLLLNSYSEDWHGRDIFGWTRNSHRQWSEKKGFEILKSEGEVNSHHAMLLKFSKIDSILNHPNFLKIPVRGKVILNLGDIQWNA